MTGDHRSSLDQVFADSFARVMGQGAYNPEFINRFYELFLASSPHIAERFSSTNMSRQKTMLHDSFTTLVDFNVRRRVSAQLEHLGAVHGPDAADIEPGLYVLWLDSLVQTVAEFDPAYTREVDLAWRIAMAPGIAYLQFAYRNPHRAAGA